MSAFRLDEFQLPTPMPRGVRKAVLDKPSAKFKSNGDKAGWDMFEDTEKSQEAGTYVLFEQPPEPVVTSPTDS